MSGRVVVQLTWAAVKERRDEMGYPTFDVWRWNVWKMKWVRMANTACGYGSAADARPTAEAVNEETATMLAANTRRTPPAL